VASFAFVPGGASLSQPAIVMCLLIASLYAGVFHFFFARRASDLPHYWVAAIIGFFLGALLGLLVPWRWLVVGQVHLLEGTLICTSALFLAHWLRGAQVAGSGRREKSETGKRPPG
jgi:hypothetical protein